MSFHSGGDARLNFRRRFTMLLSPRATDAESQSDCEMLSDAVEYRATTRSRKS